MARANVVKGTNDELLAKLPLSVQQEFRRRQKSDGPRSPADMFQVVHGWMVSAAIAEGRGGYPGLRGTPGWTDYVSEQRRYLATIEALVEAFGEPDAQLLESFQEYKVCYSPPVRLMGEGYEPYVEDVGGRLVYSLPVDSGFASASFSFVIGADDLSVLLSDSFRRAVLEVVAHEVLQSSMGQGKPEVTPVAFGRLVAQILHSTPEDLSAFVGATSRLLNVAVNVLVDQVLARRNVTADQ